MHGQMADCTRLPFYGVVQIPIRIRDVKLEEIFVVSLKDVPLQCLMSRTTWKPSSLAELLNRYQAVFSQNDQDVGKTDMVQHRIPVLAETRPIRQPPDRLEPQKEQEAEWQIHNLLARGNIKPANGAWSYPMVLS